MTHSQPRERTMKYERVLSLASLAAVFAAAPQLAAQGARFGTGCPGAGGRTPDLTMDQGATSMVLSATPDREGVYVVGPSATRWSNPALPLDLAQFGRIGGQLLVAPDLLIPLRTDDQGRATLSVPPSVIASDLIAQAVVVEPPSASAAKSLSVSNGMH